MPSCPYPSLELTPDLSLPVPDRDECEALWEKYAMLPNIRAHSRAVADVAMSLARRAEDMGIAPEGTSEKTARAAAMLHDIAKTWTILHGGAHDQLGAAIVREETGNPLLAQAVLFHVYWPWEKGPLAPERAPLRLALLVAYADKRVLARQTGQSGGTVRRSHDPLWRQRGTPGKHPPEPGTEPAP